MAENAETRPLTVNELRGKCFHIPAYQRGYRWTKSEIWALLDDVFDFEGNKNERYCLQPLIVKKRLDGENHYDVIDGQQRLTTIYIALLCTLKHSPTIEIPYIIEYDTRKGSGRFLKRLGEAPKNEDGPDEDPKKEAETNIDFHYMYEASEFVKSWIQYRTETDPSLQEGNVAGDLARNLTKSTEFIWYEIPTTENPIEVFAKENTGKIPLTSAELVKALLLCKENRGSANDDDQQQIEKSIAWDLMERRLQDDSFWYFLSKREDEENPVETRIDLVFEVLAHQYHKESEEISQYVQDPNDPYFSFLVLSRKIELDKKKKSGDDCDPVGEIWEDARHCFAHFEDWYDTFWKYHMIGYLIAVKNEKDHRELIHDIWKTAKECEKSKLEEELDKKVKETLEGMKPLEDIEYRSDRQSSEIEKILLLFNILSMLPEDRSKWSERESLCGGLYRFPFDRYKKEKWDIEHIHSVCDELPREIDKIREYFESLAETLEEAKEEEAASKIREYLEKPSGITTKTATNLYGELRRKYSDSVDLMVDNHIGNLTLLDSKTNRSYKNAMFFTKKREIISRERAGQFVPLCTKNVFLKLYSANPRDLYRWDVKHDRIEYLEIIKQTLKEYLPEGEKK